MSNKINPNKNKSKVDVQKIEQEINPEPKYLSEDSLPIYISYAGTDRPTVPPISPKELIFDYSTTRVPRPLPKLKNLKLPYVREVGVKACMDKLAEYFRCTDYKYNLTQFWFLDIMTDCLWRAQDEFQFQERQQKVILEWVLYIFNLIRAPEHNLSRKKIFQLFREAMVVAEEYIQTHPSQVPLPEELFSLNLVDDKEISDLESDTSDSTDSTISLDSSPEDTGYIAIKFKENTEFFRLPEKFCAWSLDDERMTSSEETMSDEDKPQLMRAEDSEFKVDSEVLVDEEIEYYKPDLSTPPRFKPSHVSVVQSASISLDTLSDKESEESGDAFWKDVPRQPKREPCTNDPEPQVVPSVQKQKSKALKSTSKIDKQSFVDSAGPTEDEIMQAWHDYFIWQHRMEDMANPNIGWSPPSEETSMYQSTFFGSSRKTEDIKRHWAQYVKGAIFDQRKMEENLFVNTCVLLAIKQFVFDYFYESFQYTLVRIAFRCTHNLITQSVSDHWNVPKAMHSELKKPKPTKPKKEKVKKEKKPKPEKKAKKEKKSTKSSKKSPGKSSKKSKDSKEKKKKEKPKALTKEEKAEIARLKKEEMMLEEQQRLAELNKRFMFPLTYAAGDDFFKDIFDNWVKPDQGAKESKKKGKKKT